ncbi:MAG: type II toxin-antitoxin system RelE/ParE family toxin [Acidobacteriia bacterium]|nr:type II toxin-antitoxin system RelE/ParE family toxin [Terriglobia bacterium]
MSLRVLIEARAAKKLEKLSKPLIQKNDDAILSLSSNPRPPGAKLLRGKLKEGWRIRIADYRVLYRIDDDAQEIRIFEIGHRREIYR